MPAFTPGSRPDSAERERRRAVMMKQQADIRGVLTAEQQAVYDRNVAEMRARMPGRPRGGR
jgi:Spy/CpxP family protein refolding chaperone